MRSLPRMWRTVRSHALYFHSGRLRQRCVCERHPKIRIGFLESGGGWIVPWLDRMDRHFDDKFFNDSNLETRPRAIRIQHSATGTRDGSVNGGSFHCANAPHHSV